VPQQGVANAIRRLTKQYICSTFSTRNREETTMTTYARGTFEVQLNPLEAYDASGQIPLGRMGIDKQFRGDLEAVSRGEMLTALTSVEGSAGYVAIERVSGTLGGRRGTFVLQHSGTVTRGAQSLSISVVPDSGTDELVGLAGTMTIKIDEGAHSYNFAYTLPHNEDD
jgi:hypothetical protein